MTFSNSEQLNEIVQRPYTVDISQFLKRAWQILLSNLGGFVGFTILALVILFPLYFTVLGFILVMPALISGYFFVAFRIAQNKTVSFSNFFDGFREGFFGRLLLLFIVEVIVFLVANIPSSLGFFGIVLTSAQSNGSPNVFILALAGILILLSLLLTIYLAVGYIFAIPLVIDKRLPFWDALETSRKLVSKKWWSVFGFLIVLSLLSSIVNSTGVGVLFTIPFTHAAISAAYESIVGFTIPLSSEDEAPLL